MEKRKINAEYWANQVPGLADGYLTISRNTLILLLRTYGKELLLEAAERADVTADELGQPLVNTTTITHIIDSL